MKITDYPVIDQFTDDNIMLVDGNNGTKTIKIADAIMAALHLMSPTNHRLVFRGKNLGSAVTTEQLAAIQAGTFEGLWLGDYWVINGVNWRIADFDYWYEKGDARFTKHHLVIMPDTRLYMTKMNSTATTTGAYIGSEMYTTNLAEAKAAVTSAFGDSVLSHREHFANAVSGGVPSAGAWCDSTVDLPNECMLHGHRLLGASMQSDAVACYDTIDTVQLALFKARPYFIMNANTGSIWTRDVVNASKFAGINSDGRAIAPNADWNLGVRPVFAIG
ncbi:MAG: hypothetical protein J6Q60_05490 [Bacteroidaceae bacterium]|nr:hypothetical protein [Bacteroidaceae bacterium]